MLGGRQRLRVPVPCLAASYSPEARSLARERACLGLARFAGARWRAIDAICAHRSAIPAYATGGACGLQLTVKPSPDGLMQ